MVLDTWPCRTVRCAGDRFTMEAVERLMECAVNLL